MSLVVYLCGCYAVGRCDVVCACVCCFVACVVICLYFDLV